MASHETELKFLLEPAAVEALRSEVFAGADPHELVSTYYDTADRALARRGLALRLRQGPDGWVQTIKGRGALSRYEDEIAVEGAALQPDRLAAAPGGEGLNIPDDLRPVCRVAVVRHAVLREEGGSRAEWALDEGVVQAGALGVELHELELELKRGEASDLFAAARGIARRPGVLLSFISKAERGFRLAAGDREALYHFEPPRLDPHATVREGFEAVALAALSQLCANVWRLRAEGEAEAAHQARIALRRLRTALSTFRPLVADEGFDAVRDQLKRMTALLADARSLDVFDAPGVEEDAAAGDYRAALQRARKRAYARIREGLADPAFGPALLDFAEWIVAGPWTRRSGTIADAPLAPFAEAVLRRRRRKLLRKTRRLDWRDPRRRHKVRIQAKKMRYVVDTLGGEAVRHGPFLHRLKRLQDRLGVLNDVAAARTTADLLIRDASPAAALVAGLAVASRREETPRLIRRARKAARRLRHPSLD